MAKENDGLICPECLKGTLHDGIRKEIYRYRGYETVFDQPGAFCDQCEGGLITGAEAMPVDDKLRAFRRRVDAELPPRADTMPDPAALAQAAPQTEPERIDQIVSARLDSDEVPTMMTEAEWVLARKHHALRSLQKIRQGRVIGQEQIQTFLHFWEADLIRIAREESMALAPARHKADEQVEAAADPDSLPANDLSPDQARRTINARFHQKMTMDGLKQAVRAGRYYTARYSDHTGFPAWQFHPAVRPWLPLALEALEHHNKTASLFWISEEETLENLSPAEVLAGLPFATRPKVTDTQHELLKLPSEQRWHKVLDLIIAPNPWETIG